MLTLIKSQRFLFVSMVVLAALLFLAGHSFVKLQGDMEVPTPCVSEFLSHLVEDDPVPKPISQYENFNVQVSNSVTISVYAKENINAKENIVMIHGAGSGAWAWEYYFEYLPDNYNLYALSWRGHFDSSKINDADTKDYVVDQLAVLSSIRTRNNLPAHLVGHSYGGATSILLAQKISMPLASLTLLAPVVPFHYDLSQRLIVPTVAPFFITQSNEIEGTYGNMFVSKTRMGRYHELYAGKDYSREKPSLIGGDGVSPKWQKTLNSAYENVANQGIPMHFLISRYDNVVAPERQRKLARTIGAKVTELESGHYIPLDVMSKVSAEIIADYLEQL